MTFFLIFQAMSQTLVLSVCFFLFWTLTSVGQIFDGHPSAWKSELARSSVLLALHELYAHSWVITAVPAEVLRVALGLSVVTSLAMVVAELAAPGSSGGNGNKKLKER